jgi:hypothetical protein
MIDPRDWGAFRGKAPAHPSRQVGVLSFIEIAPANAGLIADNDNGPLHLKRPKTGQIEDPLHEMELTDAMHIATVKVDNSVAVQKKSAAGPELPRPDMMLCISMIHGLRAPNPGCQITMATLRPESCGK